MLGRCCVFETNELEYEIQHVQRFGPTVVSPAWVSILAYSITSVSTCQSLIDSGTTVVFILETKETPIGNAELNLLTRAGISIITGIKSIDGKAIEVLTGAKLITKNESLGPQVIGNANSVVCNDSNYTKVRVASPNHRNRDVMPTKLKSSSLDGVHFLSNDTVKVVSGLQVIQSTHPFPSMSNVIPYFEITVYSIEPTTSLMVGYGSPMALVQKESNSIGQNVVGWWLSSPNNSSPQVKVGDIIGCALLPTTNEIMLTINGVRRAGTLTGLEWQRCPTVCSGAGSKLQINLGTMPFRMSVHGLWSPTTPTVLAQPIPSPRQSNSFKVREPSPAATSGHQSSRLSPVQSSQLVNEPASFSSSNRSPRIQYPSNNTNKRSASANKLKPTTTTTNNVRMPRPPTPIRNVPSPPVLAPLSSTTKKISPPNTARTESNRNRSATPNPTSRSTRTPVAETTKRRAATTSPTRKPRKPREKPPACPPPPVWSWMDWPSPPPSRDPDLEAPVGYDESPNSSTRNLLHCSSAPVIRRPLRKRGEPDLIE